VLVALLMLLVARGSLRACAGLALILRRLGGLGRLSALLSAFLLALLVVGHAR
jgi:hypothetical protein